MSADHTTLYDEPIVHSRFDDHNSLSTPNLPQLKLMGEKSSIEKTTLLLITPGVGSVYPVDREKLMKASPVFSTMFAREPSNNLIRRIEFTDVSLETCSVLGDFERLLSGVALAFPTRPASLSHYIHLVNFLRKYEAYDLVKVIWISAHRWIREATFSPLCLPPFLRLAVELDDPKLVASTIRASKRYNCVQCFQQHEWWKLREPRGDFVDVNAWPLGYFGSIRDDYRYALLHSYEPKKKISIKFMKRDKRDMAERFIDVFTWPRDVPIPSTEKYIDKYGKNAELKKQVERSVCQWNSRSANVLAARKVASHIH